MTLNEILTCSAETKLISKTSKSKAFEDYDIANLLETVKKIINERSSEITEPNDLYMLLCLIFNQIDLKEPLCSMELVHQKFDELAGKLEQLDLAQLGKLTVISFSLSDKHFEKIKQQLLVEFEKQDDFGALGFNSFMWIWRGLMVKYTLKPKNIQLFFKSAYNHLLSVNTPSAKMSYLAIMNEDIEYSEYPIGQALIEKIKFFIDRDSNYFGVSDKQSIPYFMFQVHCSLNDPSIALSVGVELANKFFISYFIRNPEKRITLLNRKRIFRTYLSICENLKLLQPVYLDITCYNLDIVFNDLKSKLLVTYLMPSFSSLCYLNYPDTFKGRVVNKRLKSAWDSIINKLRSSIVSGKFSSFFEVDEDFEFIRRNRKIILLNYLWSLCYMNLYDNAEIKILVESERFNNVNPEDQVDFIKLYQIDYWLKKNDTNGPMIAGINRVKMIEYKNKFDSEDLENKKLAAWDLIKNEIRRRNNGFVENFKDFPIFFDFAHVEKKIGIVLDCEDDMLKNGKSVKETGVNRILDMQNKEMGWTVRRVFTFKDMKAEDIKLDYSSLFT